jgi:AcrR family transcriptional regulator
MLALFVLGFYEYFRSKQELAAVDTQATQEVQFNQDVWQEVVGTYQERTVTFEALRNVPGEYLLPNVRADGSVVPITHEELLIDESAPVTEDAPVLDEDVPVLES